MLPFIRTTLKNYAARHFSNQEKTNHLLTAIESRLPVTCPHCGKPLNTIASQPIPPIPITLPATVETEVPPKNRYIVESHDLTTGKWLIPKEAWEKLGIKRSAYSVRVKNGDLILYHMVGAKGQVRPRGFLSLQEVAAYGKTHFPNQGKGRRKGGMCGK